MLQSKPKELELEGVWGDKLSDSEFLGRVQRVELHRSEREGRGAF